MTTAAAAHTPDIGCMPMPPDFRYKSVFLRGRPKHEKYDDFQRRHPPMSAARWAKIFSPFDALDGFDEAIEAKTVLYEPRRELSESEKEVLDRALQALRLNTYNSFAGRTGRQAVKRSSSFGRTAIGRQDIADGRSGADGTGCRTVTVTFFSPCADSRHDSFGTGGRYETITGICRKTDDINQCLTVDHRTIPYADIVSVKLEVE